MNEYPLPAGTNITQVHMISRHGSRYPTTDSGTAALGGAIVNATANGTKFTGELSFLNDWTYALGAELLIHKGFQE